MVLQEFFSCANLRKLRLLMVLLFSCNRTFFFCPSSNLITVTETTCKVIPPNWWGHKYGFVPGGLLGAELKRRKLEKSQNSNERTMFYEDDQVNLYNLVQVCTVWFWLDLCTCCKRFYACISM